eukprot:2211697-Pleurochrysis_carterae.AAC.1
MNSNTTPGCVFEGSVRLGTSYNDGTKVQSLFFASMIPTFLTGFQTSSNTDAILTDRIWNTNLSKVCIQSKGAV